MYKRQRFEPTRVDALVNQTVVLVAAGACHSLFLNASGAVYACGAGWWGRLGLGDERARLVPERLDIGGEHVAAIAAGADHSLALSRSGDVWAWGHALYGQLGLGAERNPQLVPRGLGARVPRMRAVSAGGAHSLLLAHDGGVFACGAGRFGQLGLGHWEGSTTPAPMCGVAGASSVCAGADHSLVVLHDGTVLAAGRGAIGALGLGSKGNQCTPTPVSSLRVAVRVAHAAAGVGLSLAIGGFRDGIFDVPTAEPRSDSAPTGGAFVWGVGGEQQALAMQQGLAEHFSPTFVARYAC